MSRPPAIGLVLVALLLVPLAAVSPATAATASAPVAVAEPRVPGLATPTGSVLGFQCGEGVCLIDPDVEGAQPTKVVPAGRFAGLTADGTTVAWVQPGGELVIAPTTGGTPTTVYTGSVGIQPEMSPDGARFLWTSPVPVCIGFDCFYYTYRLEVATGELVGVGACACASSHGFLGPTSIGSFPRGGTSPSRICVIGTTAETGGSSSCGPLIVPEPRGVLSFPDGSSNGQTLVAAMDPANSAYGGFQGRIALYSRATGALVKDLTTNDTDTTPTFSGEGDRVAFARNDQIMIVDVATGAERVVGPGVNPSWGGTRSERGGDNATASLEGKKLRVKSGKVAIKVACAGVGACQGMASLAQGRKVFAKKVYSVLAGMTGTAKLRQTKAGKQRFSGNGTVKLTLTLRSDTSIVRTKVKVRH